MMALLDMLGFHLVTSALAMSQEEYDARLRRLQVGQRQTESLLERMGLQASLDAPRGHGNVDEQETRAPLMVVHGSLNQARLPVGKVLYGRTLNRLVVGADGSPALVQLDEGQGAISGARMLGVAKQAGTTGRIAVEVQKLLFSSGRSVAASGVGLDEDGAYGLSAQVLSGKALAVGGAMAASFVSGLASGQQTQSQNGFGFSQVQPTGRNAILQGVAQTAADQSKRLIEEATSEKPILIAEPGTQISILIQEEVRL